MEKSEDSDSSVGVVDDPIVPKKSSKKRSLHADSENDANKANKKPKRQVNSEGTEMIPLGKNKFVTVRDFKGKLLIDIREYYDKDGKWAPTKKGISLSSEQFNDLKNSIPEIDEKAKQI